MLLEELLIYSELKGFDFTGVAVVPVMCLYLCEKWRSIP